MPRLCRFIFIVIFFLFLSSCASHKQPPPKKHIPPAPAISSAHLSHQPISQQNKISEKRKIIIRHAIQSIGTAYKWGGQSPNQGFDCSGLIVYTHKKAGIIVPRITSKQLKNGRVVQLTDIRPADLVFFKIPNKSQSLHVGLYVGDGHFVHSPGRGRKVAFANLKNPYFESNYIGIRRFAKTEEMEKVSGR